MNRVRKDKKITILEYIEKQNEIGDHDGRYEPIEGLENIWAYYRHLSGKEYFIAAATRSKVEVLFIVNWREKLTSTNPVRIRILYNNAEYEVTQIDDFEGKQTDLKIYAYKIS